MTRNAQQKYLASFRGGERSSLVVTDFVAWEDDLPCWVQLSKASFVGDNALKLTRTVWHRRDRRDCVIIIDAYRTESSDHALNASRKLENNMMFRPRQLAKRGISRMPSPSGPPCCPDFDANDLSFFTNTIGNVCLAVCGLSSDVLDAREIANPLFARIEEVPVDEDPGLTIRPARSTIFPDERVGIDYFLPRRLGETGYFKFFAVGGELLLKNGQLYLCALTEGAIVVRGFAVERGRPPSGGVAVVEVTARG